MKPLPKYLLAFALIFGTLSLIYSPALLTPYVYHDDVNFFYQTPTQPYPLGHTLSFAIGRFIGSYLVTGYSHLIDSVSDLNRLRLWGLFQLSLAGLIVWGQLRRLFKNEWLAGLAVVMIFCLPPFQVTVSYAGMNFQVTALLLSALAGLAVLKMPDVTRLASCVRQPQLYAATVLLLSAYLIYPPAAMFYWVILGTHILTVGGKDFKKLLPVLTAFGGAGLVSLSLFAVSLKFAEHRFARLLTDVYNPYTLDTNYSEKLLWFVREPLANALNLWTVFPTTAGASVTAAVILVGSVWTWRVSKCPVSTALLYSATFLGLLLLCFLPNLLAPGTAAFYRCSAALTPFLLILVLWLVEQRTENLWPRGRFAVTAILFVLLAVWGGFRARANVDRYRVQPSQKETAYVQQILAANLGRTTHVHVVRPGLEQLNARYDEFNLLTTYSEQDVVGLVTCLVREITRNQLAVQQIGYEPQSNFAYYVFKNKRTGQPQYLRLKITSSTPSEKFTPDGQTLVIDINKVSGQ